MMNYDWFMIVVYVWLDEIYLWYHIVLCFCISCFR